MEVLEQVTGLLRESVGSPWLWVIVFGVAGLDALLPFMPSETTVVTVAVLFGPDPGKLLALAATATVGAWAGDCLGYVVGREVGPKAISWLREDRYEWAKAKVDRHATMLIVAARYLPGGRVASALATGSLGYPFRRFVAYDALGAGLWAVYSVLIGLVGGAAFADEPAKGLLLSFGLGLGLVAAVESGRRLARRPGLSCTRNDEGRVCP
ncbi:DedA family protein [Amycolatopsis sp. cg5]|uniref:DedA family protein n=1 Tax=Amycolatopsis sp. cg5 TaxID=3238802 RepID=UPI0035257B7B